MKVTWKDVRLFGLNFAVPLFQKIARKLNHDRATLLASHRKELGVCERCHNLLGMKAGMSFIMHLQQVHGIGENDSYEIAADVYRQLLKRLVELRQEKAQAGMIMKCDTAIDKIEATVDAVTVGSVGSTTVN